MAKLNMSNIAAQIAAQLVSNQAQQLISGLLPLAQEMANKHEEAMGLLRQLKAAQVDIADVVVTDDGWKIMPKPPTAKPRVATVEDGLSGAVRPSATINNKPAPAAAD